jgi:ribosomal protein S18 acetylase RimI-like enzyme
MSSVEFAVFRTHTIAEYAKAHTSVGNWSVEESLERSTQAINELLPDGENTEQALVLTALNETGISIGYLWIGLQRRGGAPGEAWIYDIELYEEFRGKGYGRALLLLAEQEVRKHGVKKLGLNVFGNNQVARNLYESAGYEITSMQMAKEL